MNEQLPDAGWYDNPEGEGERYWDGQQWTDQYQDTPAGDSGGGGWKDRVKGLAQQGMDMAKEAAQEAMDQRRTSIDDAEVQDTRDALVTVESHEAGKNSMVSVYPDRIERVKARSMMSLSRADQDTEVIPIRQVSSVQAKKAGFRTNVTVYATGNEIVFRCSHDEAKELKAVIQRLILETDKPQQQPAAAAPQDDADQLRKLAELRDQGILTDEEFDAKKKQILGL